MTGHMAASSGGADDQGGVRAHTGSDLLRLYRLQLLRDCAACPGWQPLPRWRPVGATQSGMPCRNASHAPWGEVWCPASPQALLRPALTTRQTGLGLGAWWFPNLPQTPWLGF